MKIFAMSLCVLSAAALPAFSQDLDKGVEQYESRNYGAADKTLRQAVESEPDNSRALQYLGLTLTREDKAAEAEQFLRKASDLDPKSAPIKLALAGSLIEQKKYDQGQSAVDDAAAIDGDSRDLPYYRGMLNTYRKNYSDAITDLETAVERDSNNAYAHYYLGLAYSGAKRPDKMVNHFEIFLKQVPDSPESKRVKSFLKSVR